MEKVKSLLFFFYAIWDKAREAFLKVCNKCKRYFVRLAKISKEGTPAQKKELRSTIIFIVVVLIMVFAIFALCVNRWNREFSYSKALDEILFVYDDQEVELRAVTYYIMIEEEAVDESAQEYDPLNVNSYWNLHLNGEYVSEQAKKIALDYCVRDVIYAHQAKEAGIKLSEEQKESLAGKAKNIYEGLTEKQLALGLTEEDIYKALYNNQLADEWVLMLAEKEGITISERVISAYYGINSYFFKKTKADLEYVLNEELWEEIHLGSLTIN